MARKQIYQGQPGSSSAVAYTAVGTATLTGVVACNPTGTDRWLSVWITGASGTASDANMLVHEQVITALTTVGLQSLIGQTLENEQELHLQAEAADALTVTASAEVG
jgi:hypothetical protein